MPAANEAFEFLGFEFWRVECRTGQSRTARAVAEFARKASEWSAVSTRVIATSAARDALNQDELLSAIRAASGLAVEVITGEQEADWAFRGVGSTPLFAGQPMLTVEVAGGTRGLRFAAVLA